MSIVTINGQTLKNMIISGANKLAENKETIDALNVFPVPDGDTGTNMSFTALAAAREVEKLSDTADAYEVAKAASNGSLRGARGNSGVIMSQLFRGFAKGLEGQKVIDTDILATAFTKAAETAYKAVMKPKEGTILTVARETAEKAVFLSFDTDDIEQFGSELLEAGEVILNKTKDMLPVLKQANVVDAGGRGLLDFISGAYECIRSGKIEVKVSEPKSGSEKQNDFFNSALSSLSPEDIKFAYCTEFLINLRKDGTARSNTENKTESELKAYLVTIGDSVVVVADETIVKVHVHTNNPGLALEKAITYGELSSLKIENMKEQHTNAIAALNESPGNITDENAEPQEHKEYGFVAIAAGDGFSQLFKDLGADIVIEGGQTMNPSAGDIAQAVKKINADNIIILPNNKNIIFAAQQAVSLCENINATVIPSATVPQGISAMINFESFSSLQENIDKMKAAAANVKTGQITHAVRDTVIDGKEISCGDYLCLLDGTIEIVAKELKKGAEELLHLMLDDESEFVTIYYGAETNEQDANELYEEIGSMYPQHDFELHFGGQPVYYYVFSVE